MYLLNTDYTKDGYTLPSWIMLEQHFSWKIRDYNSFFGEKVCENVGFMWFITAGGEEIRCGHLQHEGVAAWILPGYHNNTNCMKSGCVWSMPELSVFICLPYQPCSSNQLSAHWLTPISVLKIKLSQELRHPRSSGSSLVRLCVYELQNNWQEID